MSQPEVYDGLLEANRTDGGFAIHGDPGPIFAALAKAQGAFGEILRTKTNPFFQSKYADFADVLSATIPHLSANGLTLLQPLSRAGDVWTVRTILGHGSGAYLEASATIPAVSDWQKLGSAVTYCRKYQASAMLSVAPEQDDDGNDTVADAGHRNVPPAKERSRPTPPPVEVKRAEQTAPRLVVPVAPVAQDDTPVVDGAPTAESRAALRDATLALGFTKEFSREWCMKLIGVHPKDIATETQVQTLLADIAVRRQAAQ